MGSLRGRRPSCDWTRLGTVEWCEACLLWPMSLPKPPTWLPRTRTRFLTLVAKMVAAASKVQCSTSMLCHLSSIFLCMLPYCAEQFFYSPCRCDGCLGASKVRPCSIPRHLIQISHGNGN